MPSRSELHLKAHANDHLVIATVPHSGTMSLSAMYPEYRTAHCGKEILKEARTKNPTIITTQRDPRRVAASWFNRGLLLSAKDKDIWRYRWDHYREILEYAKVYPVESLKYHKNSVEDKFGLHRALDEENLDYYYTHIDKSLIEAAHG